MNGNKGFDNVFENMLSQAAKQADEKIGNELAGKDVSVEFSPEHEKKMKKLFDAEKKCKNFITVSKYAKRAACFLGVLLVGAGILIGSVEAYRVKFLNFIVSIGDKNTDITFTDKRTHYSDDVISVTYIPENFELLNCESEESFATLVYSDGEKYFVIDYNTIDIFTNVDSENGYVEKIHVNGYEAIHVSTELVETVVWFNNTHVFSVFGDISFEDVMKIAENVIM